MDQSEIRAKIVEIIRVYAKDKDALASATDDTNILQDLKVNSARLVDVILDFEDAARHEGLTVERAAQGEELLHEPDDVAALGLHVHLTGHAPVGQSSMA